MSKRGKDRDAKGTIQQKSNGYKLRTTNDLQLLCMILDGDAPLRDRVKRTIELHLGKINTMKVGDND